jgi:hypothetical protein
MADVAIVAGADGIVEIERDPAANTR